MSEVILKPQKIRPFLARHPWVLDTAIYRVDGNPADGDVVDLLSDKGRFVARGVYNGHSRIRIRLYSWDRLESLDEAFWRRRLAAAVELRRQLGYDDPAGAARLVFSEGDGLSGLIVDRYADYLAVQITALAIQRRLAMILPMLVELVRPRGIMIRTERGIGRFEGLEVCEGPAWGLPPEQPVVIVENGLQYELDLTEGQKTGFYLDQRENRAAVARYLRGRNVLDMFCYSGGFALTASALGGAAEVLGVDTSQKAVTLAQANAQRNGLTNVRFEQGDGFQTMQALVDAGRRFGGIVLDPPKFARSRGALAEALRAYHWLNRLAVTLLEPGGILATCSCSGHVSREDFTYMLLGVAQQTGREIQILEQRGAAPDHPVSATCLDGEYLKCFICRVC